jgi:hypothetical protein
MSSESYDQKNDLYKKLWNEWSDGVKLSNFEFLSRLGVCEEKLSSVYVQYLSGLEVSSSALQVPKDTGYPVQQEKNKVLIFLLTFFCYYKK